MKKKSKFYLKTISLLKDTSRFEINSQSQIYIGVAKYDNLPPNW